MTPLRLWAVLLLAGTALGANAQAADPASWLGLTPETAYQNRGAPAEVFPLAIDEARWQVVHFYSDHSYLFWSSNRVWQVRLDRQWLGSVLGLTMGTPRADAEASLGKPVAQGDNWAIWNLPYQTFPRRVRLVFTEAGLADAYLYRSDL